jgi:nucleotide-binding universal stress UspA family protein
MIRKFLVAVDGSDHASKALDLAIELAGAAKATMTVMTVVSDMPLSEGEAQLARTEFKSEVEVAMGAPQFGLGHSMTAAKDRLAEAGPAASLAVREALGQRLVEMGAAEAAGRGVSSVATRVATGDPAGAILMVASEEKPDFIVMGTRGLSNMKGLLVGSISNHVVQHATCSVITVK